MNTIKRIRIKNFKSLENVEIEIKPLTFLFGPNSSGKSSFLKALMFLSKNLFPLNTSKTIYKISDEVDLGSYKDIVTNNDVKKRITFEIDFEGEYEFPIIDFLKDDDDDIRMVFDLFDNEFYKNIKTDNIFLMFEKLFSPSLKYDESLRDDELGNYFSIYKMNLTMRIVFSNFDPDYNLTRITFTDNLEKSRYAYVRKDSFPIKNNEDSVIISGEKFIFLNDKNISRLFNYHYTTIEIDLTILNIETEFPPKFNLSNLSNINFILSNSFNPDLPNKLNKKVPLSRKWNKYSDNEKIEFFYKAIKFVYLSNRLLPNLLKDFLNYKHIPITRKIPDKIYLLENNNFKSNDYYGILEILSEEFYPREFSGSDVHHLIYDKLYEEILKYLKSNKNIEKADQRFGRNLKYKDSYHYFINNTLFKVGFNQFYNIEIKEDVGKIFIIGSNNLKIYMSNASSGFLQIFPIIASCSILHNKADELFNDFKIIWNKNYIEFYENDFKKKYDDNKMPVEFYTLFIEQPELHLHPKIQSQLAELFNNTIKPHLLSKNILIETHSEHLIKKIQVLIANKELDKSNVRVFYFDNKNSKSKIKEMEIEENGFFKEPWPDGFFDESYNLSKELLFPKNKP